jgi:electron transfer flavoprotein alpha subunit
VSKAGQNVAEHGNAVLVVAEASGRELRPVSFELVTAGRQVAEVLGGRLVALLMGSGVGEVARRLGAAGADRVLVADDARLEGLTAETAAAVLARAIAEVGARVVLVPGTTAGRDYAPRVAARLGVGLAADCAEFSIEDGALVAVRPILGGRVMTAVRLPASAVQIATVRPGSFEPAAAAGEGPEAEPLAVELGSNDLRVTVRGTAPKEKGPTDLEGARTIVSGGRGLKEPDNFRLVEDLARVLDGAVGATRAVVDAGWRPHHEQIGQTGRTVRPRLYVAVGISGAVQHNVGMQASDYIVAINRDPDAPIFKVAAFGIVGDLFEVVPALTAELRAARG